MQLLEEKNKITKVLVSEMSTGLTIQKAMVAPKIFQVKKKLGMETLIKLLCVIIKSFCDSIKAKDSLDASDILECAEFISETYTHDSVKDIVMALKQAKMNGMKFYNKLSTPVILEIITEYMGNKSSYTEKRESDNTSRYDGSTRSIASTEAAERERFSEMMEKVNENKQLKAIQNEKKEMKKVADFIKKNAKNIE